MGNCCSCKPKPCTLLSGNIIVIDIMFSPNSNPNDIIGEISNIGRRYNTSISSTRYQIKRNNIYHFLGVGDTYSETLECRLSLINYLTDEKDNNLVDWYNVGVMKGCLCSF